MLSGYLRKLLVRLTVSNKYRAAVFSCRSRLDVGIRNEVVAIITNENCQALTPIVEKFVAKSAEQCTGCFKEEFDMKGGVHKVIEGRVRCKRRHAQDN